MESLQVRVGIGRVAQLGERGVRNAEVEGSNPFASTTKRQILSNRPKKLPTN